MQQPRRFRSAMKAPPNLAESTAGYTARRPCAILQICEGVRDDSVRNRRTHFGPLTDLSSTPALPDTSPFSCALIIFRGQCPVQKGSKLYSLVLGSLPTRSVRSSLSRVITCETFATESFGSPVKRAGSATLPGTFAHRRLLVRGTHTTVAIRL